MRCDASGRQGHSEGLFGSCYWIKQLSSSLACLSPDKQGILLQHIRLTVLEIHAHGMEKHVKPWVRCKVRVAVHVSILLGSEPSAFASITSSLSPNPGFSHLFIHSFLSLGPILLPHRGNRSCG